MNRIVTSATALFACALIGLDPSPARAEESAEGSGRKAIFVQTNDPGGNSVVVYDRDADGRLTPAATYPTGGKGSREVGAPSDPLASQSSLVYDRAHQLLFAVNAGSDTVSVFIVDGDQLHLTQVVSSGGPFPVSIAVHHDLAYVLDAGLAGFVSGYRVSEGGLEPISGSTRTLGLANSNPPFFLSSPGQVGFTPNGKSLIVTTKTNSTVDVFAVQTGGELSAQPVRNSEAPLPFPFIFGPGDLLVLANAGDSSVATFLVDDDGTIAPAGAPVSDGQMAACWIVSARGYHYVANTGSNDISQFRVRGDGTVTLLNPMAASGIPGVTDMVTANGGKFLYALAGSGASLYSFRVNADGSLSFVQAQPVPDGTNIQGLAAN
jgi:6-phosphogluconolactonase (cycloisomerase 2 family)